MFSTANTGVHFDGALYVETRECNIYLELGFPEEDPAGNLVVLGECSWSAWKSMPRCLGCWHGKAQTVSVASWLSQCISI